MKNSQMLGTALLALVVMLIGGSFFVVDQRERVVLFQFGEIQGTDYPAGLHFKVPFIQNVLRFDGRILTLDNQTENFLTVEKKNVEVDYYVKWRIANTTTYYRATGGQDIVAMDRLSAIINRGLRDQFGSRTVQQVVSGERDEILQSLQKNARDAVEDLGIELVDVRVKRVDLPKDVSDSVYERMRAERTRVASDLRARGAEEAEKIRAEADREAQTAQANAYRDAEKLRGEGDARASEIYSAAYGQDQEFYNFYRSLGVYRDAFGKNKDIMVLQPIATCSSTSTRVLRRNDCGHPDVERPRARGGVDAGHRGADALRVPASIPPLAAQLCRDGGPLDAAARACQHGRRLGRSAFSDPLRAVWPAKRLALLGSGDDNSRR